MFGLIKELTKEQKDQIAELISMSPEAYEQFEEAYRQSSIDGFFGPSAKSVSSLFRQITKRDYDNVQGDNGKKLKEVCDRIVDELMRDHLMLPAPEKTVTREELSEFNISVRPQLTGNLMKTDIEMPSSGVVLQMLYNCVHAKDEKTANEFYGLFRGSLDSLDLDPVCYELLGRNPNTMGHWLPALKYAACCSNFFKIPETKILKVPLPILQLSRIDYGSLTLSTKYIVNQFCKKAFNLDVSKTYFIKTGVFSSKFDFRNAKVTSGVEVEELGEYLLYISHLACQMSSYLNGHPTYGAATTNEWVVREYIEDVENNPCIYHGLPLRSEYRVFIDCDTDKILGMSPYWRADVMKKRFGDEEDKNDPNMIHDYITFKSHEMTLERRYYQNSPRLACEVAKILPFIKLKGQWSLDIMQNGDDFYLIDMATADTSALNDVVPKEDLKYNQINALSFLDGPLLRGE